MNMVIFLKIAVELDKAFVKGKKEPTNEGDEMGTWWSPPEILSTLHVEIKKQNKIVFP